MKAVANLLRFGRVTAVKDALARVDVGDHETDFIKFLKPRAGETSEWNPLTVGEQVLVAAPGGNLEQAVILMSLEQNDFPLPTTSQNQHTRRYRDGAVISYDFENHVLKAILPEGGTNIVTAPGGHIFEGPATFKNNVAIEGELTGEKSAAFDGDVSDGKRSLDSVVEWLNGPHLSKHTSPVTKAH